MIRLGNNEVLKTLTIALTFVDATPDVEGSTIALRENCSGELKKKTLLSGALWLQGIHINPDIFLGKTFSDT